MKPHDESFHPDRIRDYFRLEWLPLTFVTITGLIYNLGLLAGPWFEGQLAQCLADILQGKAAASAMFLLVLAYVLTILLVQTARFVKRFYVRRFANNIDRRMKSVLYANLLRLSGRELLQQGAGELMTKAISDVDDCAEGMRKFTTELFDTGVALIAYAGMLLFYDVRLALLSLLFPPISYLCAEKMKKLVQQTGAAYKKSSAALSAATLDRARNALTYRIYGCEGFREEHYEAVLTDYEQAGVRANVWQSALPPLYLVISNLGVLFILWFGSCNVLGCGQRVWDIAAFTTFVSCYARLSVKSSKAAKLFNAVHRAEVSWKRIQPLMTTPGVPDPIPALPGQTLVLEHVSFSYEGASCLFRDLSFTARPGDIIGITGPVACGKSTLGRIFLGEHPYEGSIRIGGQELSSLSPREIAASFGYLGHDPELWNDTVAANLFCEKEGEVLPYLAMTALDDEVLAMENGTDTVIGSSGVRLSGGQAQRLALARTLAHPRPVLILDDPFSALDRPTEDRIFANLKEYGRDRILLLISHRLYHFPEMQQILWMENGQIVAGSHAALYRTVPEYRLLCDSQRKDGRRAAAPAARKEPHEA